MTKPANSTTYNFTTVDQKLNLIRDCNSNNSHSLNTNAFNYNFPNIISLGGENVLGSIRQEEKKPILIQKEILSKNLLKSFTVVPIIIIFFYF